MKTLQELAKQALQVQDASNLSGVVISWADAIRELRATLREHHAVTDTHAINTHPINVMWSSKVGSMTGSESMLTLAQATIECQALESGLSPLAMGERDIAWEQPVTGDARDTL